TTDRRPATMPPGGRPDRGLRLLSHTAHVNCQQLRRCRGGTMSRVLLRAPRVRHLTVTWLSICVMSALAAPARGFVTFESGEVRRWALSPDGTRLFVVNTPDDRLEIFDVDAGGLTPAGSVTVGLEPVAVAARTNGEVWVVNHLSDSVSIV